MNTILIISIFRSLDRRSSKPPQRLASHQLGLSFLSLGIAVFSGYTDQAQYLLFIAIVPVLYALCHEERLVIGGLLTIIPAMSIPLVAAQGAIPVSPYLFLGIVFLSALWYAIPGIVVVFLNRFRKSMASVWVFPLGWVASEYLHSSLALWDNYTNPGAFGYGLYDTGFMQLATLSSVTAVTLAVMLVNVSLFNLIRRTGVLSALLFVGVIIFGIHWIVNTSKYGASPASPPFRITIVQGALKNETLSGFRINESSRAEAYKVYTALTRVARTSDPDMVIWPESSVPTDITPTAIDPRLLTSLAPVKQAIVGGYFRNTLGYYNAAFLWKNNTLSTAYVKRITVPTAEKQFARGNRQRPIQTTIGMIGVNICFEAAFPEISRQAVQDGADILVVITNDSWAGHTNLERWHLRASQFRAIETRRYVIHASQYGVSAVISDMGKILSRAEFGQRTLVEGGVFANSSITPFVKWGNWIGLSSLIAVIAWVLLAIALGTQRNNVTQHQPL